jgi:acetolactate synthase-1/2/3 large subunit
VRSPKEFRPVLERALASGGPWLIDIEVPRDSESDPWRFIYRVPRR